VIFAGVNGGQLLESVGEVCQQLYLNFPTHAECPGDNADQHPIIGRIFRGLVR
jgi:hypothetical protein